MGGLCQGASPLIPPLHALTPIQKNPKAEMFKHKGWALFEAVDNIIPDKAKGKYIYIPSQAPAPDPMAADNSDTPASDSEDDPGAAPSPSEEEGLSQTTPSSSSPYVPPPPPPAPSTGRKRSALETSDSLSSLTPPLVAQRLPRETAVSRSINRMSEVLASLVTPAASELPAETLLESTPKRRRIAVELAAKQEEDELSEDDMVELVEVMRRDITAADTYLSLSKTSSKLRQAWVRRVVGGRYS